MGEFIVSTRYASSLYELAEEKNQVDEVSIDMELVCNTLVGARDLQNALANPIISSNKKETVLCEIFESKIGKTTLDFIKFVVLKNRENLLLDITQRFLEIKDEKLGYVNVLVKSVVEFTDQQKEALLVKLQEITNKKVRIDYKIDAEIVGGFIVKIGDTIMDASIKHQLGLLRKQFLKEAV